MGCHFFLQAIFPTQGWNLGLPHGRQILYRLNHQGSPKGTFYSIKEWGVLNLWSRAQALLDRLWVGLLYHLDSWAGGAGSLHTARLHPELGVREHVCALLPQSCVVSAGAAVSCKELWPEGRMQSL